MKIPEFVVDIEPGGTAQLRLCVHARDLAPIDDEVERPFPRLLPADLDELRSGYGSERITESVAEQVSDWLLKNDLRGHLGTAIHAAESPFRIIIRPHVKVLPSLVDVPFELLKLDTDPLALQRSIRAIVHTWKMKHRSPIAPASALRRSWPLRILLVRTNPRDLGGMVPPALPIRDRVLEIARECGLAERVEVTVLSSEAGDEPVTYDVFREVVRNTSYDLLVYLGHGDLQDAGFEGSPPSGVLLFEADGGDYANPVLARQLGIALQHRPVPVVVLAGCLTAASDAVKERLPRWMRGSQSVAQALIDGGSGVQCAIGMRHRLETADAERFLDAFVRSLLKDRPGDVETAVHAGREEMYAQKIYPPSWSAPVLFSAASPETLLDFLRPAAGPVEGAKLIDPLDEEDQRLRQKSWKALSELPGTPPSEARRFATQLLDKAEATYIKRRTQRGACVIWPSREEAKPGDVVRVYVQLTGALSVSRLEGRLTFAEAITVRHVKATRALTDARLRVLSDLSRRGEVLFTVKKDPASRPGRAPAMPAPGPLFEVELSLPGACPMVYYLRVDLLVCEPELLLYSWDNAIVVPLP